MRVLPTKLKWLLKHNGYELGVYQEAADDPGKELWNIFC